MELRRLRLLAELRHHGTIAQVAETLGYSPSSVSVQLAELEREARVPLLRRAGRNVVLTAAGLRLAEYAEEALAADEAIAAELATISEEPVGRFRLSFVQTVALALLPPVVDRLARSAPKLRVELVHRETVPALEELRARGIDMAVGIDYDPVPPPSFRDVHRVNLIEEDVLLAVPAQWHPRKGVPIAVPTLEHRAWAAGPLGGGHTAAIEYICSRLGNFAPDIRHRTDDALILRALVSSGQAVTLLPALIGTATPQVSLRPIDGIQLRRSIFTATRAASRTTPAVRMVREALRQAAADVSSARTDVRAFS